MIDPGRGTHPTLSSFAWVFSPRRNLSALFVRPRDNFAPLDGIRGLFTTWVIAAHCMFALGPVRSRIAIEAHPLLRAPLLAHYAIDTFFVMSGFLIAHLIMRERQTTGTFLAGRFFSRRALRLLPAYYVAIAVCLLFDRINTGRAFYNLLYINNSLPFTEQFMPWTWSLAVEEQFYLALPLVLAVMYRLKRWRGLYLTSFIFFAAWLRLVLVDNGGFGAPMIDLRSALVIGDALYTKTYSRFGSLACGVLIAYLVHYRPGPLDWLDRSPRAALAIALACIATIGVLFMPGAPIDIQFFQFGNAWPAWSIPLGVALNRCVFAIAFSYLMVLMLRDSRLGRSMARILALPIWYPFAQLSYSAYLFHPLVVRLVITRLVPPRAVDVPSMAVVFVVSSFLTYAIAFVVYMAVERPGMNLRSIAAAVPGGADRIMTKVSI